MDNTIVHPSCAHLAHLVDLFVFKGAPANKDPDRQVQILVNHGYVVGFCPDRRQPLWSAYRVAGTKRDIDFDRPHLYYADKRLDQDVRLSSATFGRKDGIGYHVGHMTPNHVINRQFGRLAQMETFLMSNMSPQRGTLNTGVWLRLEDKIRNIEDTSGKDHIWAIAGPIFGPEPDSITRVDGISVPIPEAYFCITVDPFRYPWDRQSNVDVACFRIPQDADRATPLEHFLRDLEEIEEETNLEFFRGWDHSIGESVGAEGVDSPWLRHRLLRQI
ncbi:DNA/RNA non-specific endonuclease [Roseimaritima ulvae]|uniref:Nuclease n=1 Tax=Roseimaritima ulvae TaxID=980254 RepID=A0A5B9R9G5_9BACT|nr:DNA/RNA non-specific endonuclease [Roseimaritima ulvae]QEG43463.1 Nuclease precursor [Roseimaritima ulvae]